MVVHATPTEADTALHSGKFEDAAKLYQAAADKSPDSAAKVGLVRSLLGQGKLAEALDLANKYSAAAPNDAALADAVGEARFRRGEIDEAAIAFNKAQHLDVCLPAVHADIARYQTLAGNFLAAQKQIDLAHQFSPDDPSITAQWQQAHARPATPQQVIAHLTEQANRADATPEQKKLAESRIKLMQARNNGDCEAVEPKESVKMPMLPIQHPNGELSDNEVSKVGLDLEFNGKRLRLMVDTGASGLVLNRASTGRLGLTPEAETSVYGFGDQGSTKTEVAHVDTVRVGGMEFHNCEVEVVDRQIDETTDGLIGPDVFARWVVTIDIPSRELRLSPLPKRPGDEASNEPLKLDLHGAIGYTPNSADGPHDRYIAPEMQTWTRIYRRNHDLIVPVKVNDLPTRLFIMDTGAWTDNLNMDTAKMLGRLTTDAVETRGLSGYVKHNYVLETPTMLAFAGVKQEVRGISVLDIGGTTRNVGVEISGFLGFKTLREFIISIDYRDNLVKITYDPSKGFHSKGNLF